VEEDLHRPVQQDAAPEHDRDGQRLSISLRADEDDRSDGGDRGEVEIPSDLGRGVHHDVHDGRLEPVDERVAEGVQRGRLGPPDGRHHDRESERAAHHRASECFGRELGRLVGVPDRPPSGPRRATLGQSRPTISLRLSSGLSALGLPVEGVRFDA
jgi:hypothetical protein